MQAYSKFISALLAALAVVASSGLLDGQTELILNTVIAAVGAGAVWYFPNIHKGDGGPEPESMPYESSN